MCGGFSDQLDWSQSHKDLMVMIQEIKKCLPEEKRSSSKPSTISALNYALRCVQQVRDLPHLTLGFTKTMTKLGGLLSMTEECSRQM